MQLSPGERSILAYFPSSSKALAALEALKAAGFTSLQVDRISRYGVTFDHEYNNPIAGRAYTQTGLSLFSAGSDNFSEDDSRILLGADPSVEGYVPPDFGQAGERAFLLTVVAPEDKIEGAGIILKENGAFF